MRFHVAMDSLEKEVKIWRFAVIALLILSICLCIGILKTAQKNPLIIERGCLSKTIEPIGTEVTDFEIQQFISIALEQRFNSSEKQTNLISGEQFLAKTKEQLELSRQQMSQVVITNRVQVLEKEILVNADRLISVGEVRSAFKFPLRVLLERVSRTESNPYGLILSEVKSNLENKQKDSLNDSR